MGKRTMAVLGGMLLLFYPLAGVAVVLWVFWDDLCGLTLAVHDDRCLARARKALKRSVHAEVLVSHAHAVAEEAREARRKEPRRWSGMLRGRFLEATRLALGAWEGLGPRTSSAASAVRICFAYLGRGGRPTIPRPVEVPVAVNTDNWQGA